MSVCDIFGDNSCIALYEFENNANDSCGNYNGKWIGNESYDTGIIGKAAKFDGESYINLGELKLDLGYTISFWSKNMSGFCFCATNTDDNGNDFNIAADYFNGGYCDCHTNYTFNNNEWYLITVIIPQSGDISDLLFYVNGENIPTTVTSSINKIRQDGDNYLVAGKAAYHNRYFHGLMDQIRIFNRPLSENEIKILYSEPIKNKYYIFSSTESTANINIKMQDINKPTFISDMIYTDYKKEEVTSNSYILNNSNYKYGDVFILIYKGNILKNGVIIDSNCNGIYFYSKCQNNDKFDIDGAVKKIIVVYHNGYWQDYGLEDKSNNINCNIFGDSSCIALYTFDDKTANDSCNNYNGKWVGIEQYVAGVCNGLAAKFENGSYINLSNLNLKDALLNNKGYTICVWFTATNKCANEELFSFGKDDIRISTVTDTQILINWLEHKDFYYKLPYSIFDDKFHFISISLDYVNKKGYLYLDGKLIKEESNPTINTIDIDYGYIGAETSASDGHVTDTYNGLIDQVRIFNRSLSGDEIQQLYAECLNN